jgi:hypothetical protein
VPAPKIRQRQGVRRSLSRFMALSDVGSMNADRPDLNLTPFGHPSSRDGRRALA